MGNRCLRRDAEQAGGVLAGTSGRSLDAVYICRKEGGMSHEGKGLGLAKLVGLAWQRNWDSNSGRLQVGNVQECSCMGLEKKAL